MLAKLTTARIEKLEPEDKQYFIWDDKFTGLGLRVSPGGSKTFIYQGRVAGGGVPKRITLGKFPLFTLQDAIDKASELSKQMVAGIDPNRQKKEEIAKNNEFEKAERRNSIMLGDAFTDYMQTQKSTWSKTYYSDHMQAVRPHLGQEKYSTQPIGKIWHMPLADLTPDFIESWVKEENKTRPTSMAKNFRMFKAFCNWAEETEKYVDLIPQKTYNSKKVNKAVAKVKSHKGALQKQQLADFFKAMETISEVQRACLLSMLMNGSRPNEMLSLK